MRPREVDATVRAAGRQGEGRPYRVPLDVAGAQVQVTVSRCIYLAYARDGELHYIGKVDRASGSAGERLREHLRTSARKRRAWRSLWVVPLSDSMSVADLLALERSLIHAHRPVGNVQHVRQAA